MLRKVLLMAAVTATAAATAQTAAAPDSDEVVYEVGALEFVHTSPELRDIILQARPAEKETATVPKFAVTSKNKKFVMAIGGKINPIMGYDIGNDAYARGDGINFTTGDIPVPAMPGHRADFFINPLKAFVDFSVVGLAGTDNQITGYLQLKTNGSQSPIRLHRAYVTWRGLTAGQTATLMEDEDGAQPATIDPQGPSGEVSATAYQVAYKSKNYNGFRFAVGVEMPTFYSADGIYRGHDYAHRWGGITVTGDANQLAPDVPAWVEYKAADGVNRVRLSGVLRNFFYRDLLANKTRHTAGWGVMLSGNFSFWKPLTFNYQGVYGRGIGAYIQDLSGRHIGFTPNNDKVGSMTATPMMGLSFGASLQATKRLQFNAVGSYARVWGCRDYATLGTTTETVGTTNYRVADADNYHYAVYAAVNAFYKITDYFTWGVEYLYGQRATWDLGTAHDNRVQTQLIFTF